jgi:hypothetical protein
MRYLILAVLLLSLTCISSASGDLPSSPAYEQGNGLLSVCTTDEHYDTNFGMCLGFIDGVLNGAQLSGSGTCTTAAASHWCIPPEVTMGQIRDVVVKSLREHPETRHERSIILIANAMIAAWPCPPK